MEKSKLSTSRIPYNEFSEQFTGDFGEPDKPGCDDTMMYYLMNPEKSDCPEDARKQKEWWKAGCPRKIPSLNTPR